MNCLFLEILFQYFWSIVDQPLLRMQLLPVVRVSLQGDQSQEISGQRKAENKEEIGGKDTHLGE
jgi:hypothetical protein